MQKTLLKLLALTALLAPALMTGQSSRETLLALSKHDHTVAIVDPMALKVLAKAPVGNDPHEVIASADGKTAYVSNYGGGSFNTLAVIDLVGRKALPSIDLGALKGPHGLDLKAESFGSLSRDPKPLAATTLPRRKSIGSWAPARIART